MVLLTFVWKCFQDRNFHGVVVGLYEQSIESWVGLMPVYRSGNAIENVKCTSLIDWVIQFDTQDFYLEILT